VQISVSVSISSGLERLRTQFFTIFHKTLRTARKTWSPRWLLFLRRTGSRRTILAVCKFRLWQFHDCGEHIFPRIVAKIRPELKLINIDFVLGGQRNRKCNSDFRGVQITFSFSSVLKQALVCSVELWSIKCNLELAFVIAHKRIKRKRKPEFALL